MIRNIILTIFNGSVLIAASLAVVWLLITGFTASFEGLLLTKAGLLAAILFAFRISDQSDPARLSIWAGPWRRARSLA